MAESPVVLGSGLVVIRNALSEEKQCWLAKYAKAAGQRPAPKGWYKADGSLNATKTRGRVYDEVQNYPESEKIEKLCLDLVDAARKVQPKLPKMSLTHMLLLLYTSAEGMGWHKDSDPNDGDNDHPIVSISLGNTSEFGYKPLLQPEQSLVLRSGDVLIWGGPQRMLEHCVAAVHPKTVPSHLEDNIPDSRVNFTFRSAPNILGKTKEFSTDSFWVDQ